MAIDDNKNYTLTGAQVKGLAAEVNGKTNTVYLARSGNTFPLAAGSDELKGLCKIVNDFVFHNKKSFAVNFERNGNNIPDVATDLQVQTIQQVNNYVWMSLFCGCSIPNHNSGSEYYGINYSSISHKSVNFYVPKTEYENQNIENIYGDTGLSNRYLSFSNNASLLGMRDASNGPLSTTNTRTYTPTGAYNPATKKYVDDKILTNAGAPTTSTVGTVGQVLQDTTNGKLYICTAIVPGTAPDPDTYTWVEVGTGGSSGGGFKVLTSADYNWNTTAGDATTTPFDAVAMWLMPAGHYEWDNMTGNGLTKVVIDEAGTEPIPVDTTPFFIFTKGEEVAVDQYGQTFLFTPIKAEKYGDGEDYTVWSGAMAPMSGVQASVWDVSVKEPISNTNYTQPDASKRTLAASTGPQFLAYTDARVKTNAGVPTSATVGTVGQLYEDTTNGKLYICTAVASNPASYTWEEVGGSSTIVGNSAPTSATAANVGQFYIDRMNLTTYVCMADSGGTYVWATVDGGASVTVTDTDPGEYSPLPANSILGVYDTGSVIMDYSTAEQATGYTWTDGSMIYKKTVNIGALPDAGTKAVSHNIASLGKVIKVEGFAFNGTISLPIPYIAAPSYAGIAVFISASEVTVKTSWNVGTEGYNDCYVTLYYIKGA